MSLTSELNKTQSPIYQFFHQNFQIDNFLKENNELIHSSYTIKPSYMKDYPWADIGHITEYLMLLHMNLPFPELFPMRLGKAHIKNESFQNLHKALSEKYKNINSFFSDKTKFTILCNDLFKLSKVEGLIRGNIKFTFSELNSFYLQPHMLNDLLHLYFESLKVNELINNPSIPFVYNPHFDLSIKIKGADADLYFKYPNGNYLIDLKTTIRPSITKDMIYQLLGYVFLDTSNSHNITDIGVYLTRQNLISKWNINEIINSYTTFHSTQNAQDEFVKILFTI